MHDHVAAAEALFKPCEAVIPVDPPPKASEDVPRLHYVAISQNLWRSLLHVEGFLNALFMSLDGELCGACIVWHIELSRGGCISSRFGFGSALRVDLSIEACV